MNVKERYDLAMKNAAFVLDKIAHAKKGDNIVVLADQPRYRNARLFCECAKNLGINAVILDFDIYGGDDKFMKMPIMEPVRQAILHADITFMVTPQILTGFDYYIGDQSSADKSLTGVGKRYTFEIDGLDQWEINEEEVLANFTRARNLYSWLRKANEVHVTTKRGTDLRVKVGSAPDGMYEELQKAGVGTVIAMHMPKSSIDVCRKCNINVVISGHMSSDSLGVNLICDEWERHGIEVFGAAGFTRVSRN